MSSVEELQKKFNEKDGWERLTYDIDAWWVPEEGKSFKGELLAVRIFDDKLNKGEKRKVYLMRSAVTVMAVPSGQSKKEGLDEFPAGSVIAFGESYGLKELSNWSSKTLVMLKSVKKQDVGGRSLWKYDIACKGDKVPMKPITSMPETVIPKRLDAALDISDDDIPF